MINDSNNIIPVVLQPILPGYTTELYPDNKFEREKERKRGIREIERECV
jgi:hypothetical protein